MKYKLYEFISLPQEALHQEVHRQLALSEQEGDLLLPLQTFLCKQSAETLASMHHTDLFKKVHPRKKYTEGYQRQLLVMLQSVYEKALYQLHTPIDSMALTKLYRAFKLPKNYHASLREVETNQSQHVYKDDYFLQEMSLYNEKINQSIFLEKMTLAELRQWTEQIDASLDQYYLLQKIKNLLSLHNIDRTYPLSQINYFAEIESFVNSEQPELSPLLFLYKHCYKLQIQQQETSFEVILQTLFDHHALMPAKEKKDLSAMLSNYCIKKINSQQFEFYSSLMTLYQFNVQHQIIIENNIIVSSTFRNYVQIALRNNETQWAHGFIKNHQQYLKSSERESTVSICQALLYFKENKFEKTIHALTQVNFHDYQLDILARLLLARAYYELDEAETLGYLIDSFKKYLQRNKKIDMRLIVACKNFLKLLSAMTQLNPRDKAKIQKIKTAIYEHPQLAEKQWLTEKINEF